MRQALWLLIVAAAIPACVCSSSAMTSTSNRGANAARSGVYDVEPVSEFGQLKWILEAEDSIHSPVIANGWVFFAVSGHGLRAVDLQTGKEMWRSAPGKNAGGSFAIAGDVVYSGSGNRLDAVEVGGRDLWSLELTGSYVTSIVMDQGVVYARTDDGRIHAVDATTGRLKWRHEPPDVPQNHPHPAVGGGYVVTRDTEGRVYALDAATGQLAWKGPQRPSRDWPAIAGSTVYLAMSDRHIAALNLKTGKVKWDVKVDVAIHTPFAVGGGLILAGTRDNGLCAFDARTGALKWRGEAEQDVRTAPVVAGHMAYANCEYGLCAVEIRTGAVKWRVYKDAPSHFVPTVGGGMVCFATASREPTLLYAVEGDCSIEKLTEAQETGTGVFPSLSVRDKPEHRVAAARHAPPVSALTVWDDKAYVAGSDGALHEIHVLSGKTRTIKTGGDLATVPIVVGNVAYVGGRDGTLYAVKLDGSGLLWRFAAGGAINAAPLVLGDTVFVGTADNDLHAVGTLTGQKRWTFRADAAIASSPSGSGGLVFVGSDDGTLYAVDAGSGELAWRCAIGGRIRAKPVTGDARVFVPGPSGTLHAIAAKTGKPEWVFNFGGAPTQPALWEGTVFFSSDTGRVCAIDAATGRERWVSETLGERPTAPSVAGGLVHVVNADGDVHALDAATGKSVWRCATGADASAPPCISRGVVCLAGADGRVHTIAQAPAAQPSDSPAGTHDIKQPRSKPDLKWKFETGMPGNGWTMVSDSLAYAISGNFMQAVELDTGKPVWRFGAPDSIACAHVAEGNIYLEWRQGEILALDAATGQRRWTQRVPDRLCSGFVSMNGVLLLGSWSFRLYALDCATGEVLWERRTKGGVRGSLIAVGDEVLYVSASGLLESVQLHSGKPNWKLQLPHEVYQPPVLADGLLYIACDEGPVVAVNPDTHAIQSQYRNAGRPIGRLDVSGTTLLAGTMERTLVAIDVKTGKVRWTSNEGISLFRMVRAGLLYRTGKRGTIEALDVLTGERTWELDVDLKAGFSYQILDNGTMILLDQNGCLYAYE